MPSVNGVSSSLHLLSPTTGISNPFPVPEDVHPDDSLSNLRSATVSFPSHDTLFAVHIDSKDLGPFGITVAVSINDSFFTKTTKEHTEGESEEDDNVDEGYIILTHRLIQDPYAIPGSMMREEMGSYATRKILIQVALAVRGNKSRNWTGKDVPEGEVDGPVVASFVYDVECPGPEDKVTSDITVDKDYKLPPGKKRPFRGIPRWGSVEGFKK